MATVSTDKKDESTCPSSPQTPLGKGVATAPATSKKEDEPVAMVPRSLMECVDPVGIVETMVNFDYNRVIWSHVVGLLTFHTLGLLGLMKMLTGHVSCATLLLCLGLHVVGAIGFTAGYHRRFSHRAYKAHHAIDIMWTVLGTFASQPSIYHWASDHRVHHNYSETEADPHTAERGLFFAHIGYLCVHRSKEFLQRLKECNLADLHKDPLVMWQDENFVPFTMFLNGILPTFICYFIFGEELLTSFLVACGRSLLTFHATLSVNSFAHWMGDHPYDARIYPVENYIVALVTVGEGWHNFHHAFQTDYRTSDREDPLYLKIFLNPTSLIIDSLAAIGLVSNRVSTPKDIIQKHKAKYGWKALKSKSH